MGRRTPGARFHVECLEPRRVMASLAGTVYEDTNANGMLDAGEAPIPGVVMYLDANANGRLDQHGFGLDPDAYRDGETLGSSRLTVVPSATGRDNQPAHRVFALDGLGLATTGQLVFAHDATSRWGTDTRLRFDFDVPVNSVSLDAIGTSPTARTAVVLDAFAADGRLLDRVRVENLSNAEMGRLSMRRTLADIGSVVAYVAGDRGSATFDNLRANDAGDEWATVSSAQGFYWFPQLPSGTYLVRQEVPEGFAQFSPSPDLGYEVELHGGVSGLNFGNRTASVSGLAFQDQGVVGRFEPGRDALLAHRALYLDTNANGSPDPRDLAVQPDTYASGEVLQHPNAEVTLTVVGSDGQPTSELVVAGADQLVNPDGNVFTHEGDANWSNETRLRVEFAAPASFVSLDFIAAGGEDTESGALFAYAPSGQLLAMTQTPALRHGMRATMAIRREGLDIGYVVAYTADAEGGKGRLDNLRATVPSEPVVFTDDEGRYTFKPLAAGIHEIRLLPATGENTTYPRKGFYAQPLAVGDMFRQFDFGVVTGNLPPVAEDDHAFTTEDEQTFIDVLANDFDLDGDLDRSAIEVTVTPAHGVATVGADGVIIYTPSQDFAGVDTLVYSVRDDQLAESNSASVSITVEAVNDAPRTREDVISILGAGETTIGVLSNDQDVDSRILPESLAIVTSPRHGTAHVDPLTGNVLYASDKGESDSFTYRVADVQGLVSAPTTVTVVSLASGTPPVAREDEVSVAEGTRVTLHVLGNDSDDGWLDTSSVVIVRPPSHGEATLDGNGAVDYRPRIGFVGTDAFDYLVRDNLGLASNTATATVFLTERAFPYQNPLNRFDINGDGFIVPRDALLIINEINERRVSDPLSGAIRIDLGPGERPDAYLDVTGDGFVVARDVLFVVNYLNGPARAIREILSTESAKSTDASPVNLAAAAALYARFEDPFSEDEDDLFEPDV